MALKRKIQLYGALTDEAWTQILETKQVSLLDPNENFIRKENQFIYVLSGLLKEYTSFERKRPSIINIIKSDNCIITRKQNKQNTLTASMPTLILHWDFDSLVAIYKQFKNLIRVYDILCAQYDMGIAFRSLILETPGVEQRIRYLKAQYGDVIPYLKKTEIANYLHLNYHHFIKKYNAML